MTGLRLPRSSFRHGRHARRIGPGLEVERARGQGHLGGLLLEHVDGQGHEDRSARRVLSDLERAAQERGHFVGALHLRAPLDERRRHRHEIVAEQGRAQAKARVLLSRGQEQGEPALLAL